MHTCVDSFILLNNETFNEKETLTDLVATSQCNIVADTEKEENKTKVLRHFSKTENHRKVITGLGLQNSHPLVVNLESQEESPQHNE